MLLWPRAQLRRHLALPLVCSAVMSMLSACKTQDLAMHLHQPSATADAAPVAPGIGSHNFRLPSGVWMVNTDSSSWYRSLDQMRDAVDKALALGVNAIYPVVWNKQQFFFNSQTVAQELDPNFIAKTQAGSDVLAELIRLAHSRQMRIFPSLESGLKVVMRQEGGSTLTAIGELIAARPDWLAEDRNGEAVEMCHFDVCFSYLNILNPEVRDFLLRLAADILMDYEVDGLIFDDHFSMPAAILGCDPLVRYNPALRAEFEQWQHQQAFWKSWNREGACIEFSNILRSRAIIDFFATIHITAQAHGKKIILSPAGLPGWSKREWLQDWESMVRQGHLDGVLMQVFRGNTFRMMMNSPELNFLHHLSAKVPFGVVILLGLKEYHVYASGKRIASQTDAAIGAGKTPSYYYHEMIDIPIKGQSQAARSAWIKTVQTQLSAYLMATTGP